MSSRRRRHESAHYECKKCGRKWKKKPPNKQMTMEDFVIEFGSSGVVCTCGHMYVKWTNYEQWRKRHEGHR